MFIRGVGFIAQLDAWARVALAGATRRNSRRGRQGCLPGEGNYRCLALASRPASWFQAPLVFVLSKRYFAVSGAKKAAGQREKSGPVGYST